MLLMKVFRCVHVIRIGCTRVCHVPSQSMVFEELKKEGRKVATEGGEGRRRRKVAKKDEKEGREDIMTTQFGLEEQKYLLSCLHIMYTKEKLCVILCILAFYKYNGPSLNQ